MTETHSSSDVRLDNVLVATDFSPASKQAVLYAAAIARRHNSKLFLANVVTSRSESALMEGWRAGQAEVIEQLLANRLDGVRHELVVRAGEIGDVLAHVIAEKAIDLTVIGTRGRTGVVKFLLGSVAENIFRRDCNSLRTTDRFGQTIESTGCRERCRDVSKKNLHGY